MAVSLRNLTTKTINGSGFLYWKLYSRRVLLSVLKFLDHPHKSELGIPHSNGGNLLNGNNNYLFLPEIFSAKKHLYAEFVSFVIFTGIILAGGIYAISLLLAAPVLTVVTGFVALFYLTLMVFKLSVVKQSLSYELIDFTEDEINAITDEELPTYTILVPVKYEAEVMGQTISALENIDYPKNKLDVIVPMEYYDRETIDAFNRAKPAAHIKSLIMPYITPQTKPKSLNVAFLESKGEFVVIYDAEIIPDRDQLKKAYLAFRKYPDISILQTRLDHYNANDNLITKLFCTEFSFYYDMFLPGLQKSDFPIPLSGHSVHFRHEAIKKIGAWDPYNVTEDCDVGIRMFRRGYRSGIINSFSKEEATNSIVAWVKQRTRWMKGFIQTSLVHLRHPFRLARELGGWKNFSVFLLTIPGTVFVNVLNLITWIMFIIWIVYHPPVIKALYPQPILFISGLSFMIGGFIFTYLNLLGAYKRGRFSIVKYALLTPIYWLMLAFATVRAVFQIISDPHSWEKTTHGTHIMRNVDAVSAT